ncbi:MAG: hypothetical protein ACTSUE_03545 [Promethearchaeota archaeon]
MKDENPYDNVLKSCMYKIAGLNQLCLLDKKNGTMVSNFSKFATSDNITNIAEFSLTLVQLSKLNGGKDLAMNTIEFESGEKLFTVSGGDNIVLSAVSDKNVQIGISRMYLKRIAQRLDKHYPRYLLTQQGATKDKELVGIFQELTGKD